MRPSDVTTFTNYRNHPDIARYQDWELPYTRDLAHKLIDDMDGIDGPVPGEWVQLAIDAGDEALVGDLAVFVDTDTRLAIIGYTMRPAHQGRGYATEAAGALVDRLFDRLHVHRVAATLDPANVASARVLERLGFRYEGCGRKAAYVRGEWVDDDRYAILADERRAWRERAMGPPSMLRLVEITQDNVYRVARLATHHTQERFVATMPESYTDALVPEIIDGHPVVPWMRAIEADGELVGFLMLAAADRRARHLVPLAAPHRRPPSGTRNRQLVHFASSANTSPQKATPCSRPAGSRPRVARRGSTASSGSSRPARSTTARSSRRSRSPGSSPRLSNTPKRDRSAFTPARCESDFRRERAGAAPAVPTARRPDRGASRDRRSCR